MIRSRNRNSRVNRRCDWTLKAMLISHLQIRKARGFNRWRFPVQYKKNLLIISCNTRRIAQATKSLKQFLKAHLLWKWHCRQLHGRIQDFTGRGANSKTIILPILLMEMSMVVKEIGREGECIPGAPPPSPIRHELTCCFKGNWWLNDSKNSSGGSRGAGTFFFSFSCSFRQRLCQITG